MQDHELLEPEQTAELLGVTKRTLTRWQALRVGPPRVKIGRRVLYRRTAVMAWLADNETAPVRRFAG